MGAYGSIDNLGYYYTSNTNRLYYIFDYNTNVNAKPKGFNPGSGGAGYDYDLVGNLKSDSYKGITNINYNYLNLPTTISWGSTKSIDIVYDAAGNKLSKTVKTGTTTNSIQDYVMGIEYNKLGTAARKVESVYHSEGRYFNTSATSTPSWRAEYIIKDHLGNARLSITDKNNDAKIDVTNSASTNEILQENHYYSFGMAHEGPWMINDAAKDNPYQYNGKEFNADHGLNWNDYGMRYYDPTIGKWMRVDPLAGKYPNESPYNYVSNNPILFIDPDGREKIIGFDKNKKDDQVIIAGAEKYQDDGAIHIFGHGNTKGIYLVMDGKRVSIESPEQLNSFLNKNSETWQNKGDEKPMIVLHSCNTGRDQNDGSASFAEKVSGSELFKDATIVAPNERDYISENGETGTYKAKYADKNGVYKTDENGAVKSKERSDTPGSWRLFKNGEQIEQYRGDWKPKEQPTLWDKLTKKED